VGAGQALSNIVGLAIGLVLVRRRLNGLPLSDVTRTYVRLGVASVVAGAAAILVQVAVGQVLEGRLYSPASLVAGGVAFAGVYLVVARRLHVREIDDLVRPLLDRVRRSLPTR
jgi:putative peptidoglycan lipid II flippase